MTLNTGANRLRIALPDPSTRYEQDSEWCVVDVPDAAGGMAGWQEVRFHDYDRIYRIPGMYERLFYDILQCSSPPTVGRMLRAELARVGVDAAELRVLDLGAGNGIMAEELRASGVGSVVGVDIIAEAREAALRDRPGVYDDYHVVDMTALTDDEHAALAAHRLTGLTCVAALGFGDIPPAAFRAAFNLVDDGGWVAFTIKDGFLGDEDTSGFAGLIKLAIGDGHLDALAAQTYQHRVSTAGEPLHYQAMIGRKRSAIPS